MDQRALRVLEFDKVRERLATYATFSLGQALARQVTPVDDIRLVGEWQAETREARRLLEEKTDFHLGGVHDVRPLVDSTVRGSVLAPADLVDVRDTLVRARTLQRTFSRLQEAFPHVADVALRITVAGNLIDEIGRCVDERGEVLDRASEALAQIRRDLRTKHDRLLVRLQHIISTSTNAPYLQEQIVTQRQGRYVIPLRAEFKGRIPGLVHDQSGSGATLFIEPLSVVDLNNGWREAQLAEQEEIYRILVLLSSLVAEAAPAIRHTIEALGDLDLIFARGRYANALMAVEPELLPFQAPARKRRRGLTRDTSVEEPAEPHHPGSVIRFMQARHPLLDPLTVVPVDIYLEEEYFIVLITGPNTGGKTVSLKTVGLLTAMAQAGLHIPVDLGSAVSHFGTIFADIGDEQSIEQSLSTFSGHLANIMSFLDQADRRSLVLLDELGAGTDPAEGAALARALLDHFRARGVTTFVATHYPELKSYAQVTPGAANASVEFDSEALSPTFRLMIGLPGRSNALAIARRLGLPDSIVDEARRIVSHDDRRTEDMLADIDRLRIQMAEARDEASAARSDVQALSDRLRGRLDNIEQERRELLDEARQGIAEEVESLRAEARALRRRLQAAAAPIAAVVEIEKATESLVCETSSVGRDGLPDVPVVSREFRVGDTVWVEPLNATGHVLALGDEEAEVQVGPARTRVRLSAVQFRARPSAGRRSDDQSVPTLRAPAVSSPGVRVDLRGLASDDALDRLDRHLDSAWRAGLPWLHIIHGKGTGTLRRAVRGFLLDHPLVSGYERGGPNEGGEGVTIAKLVER